MAMGVMEEEAGEGEAGEEEAGEVEAMVSLFRCPAAILFKTNLNINLR